MSSGKVFKIGGSCLQSQDSYDGLWRIREKFGNGIFVFSAFDGVTDKLIKNFENGNKLAFAKYLLEKHRNIVSSKLNKDIQESQEMLLKMNGFNSVDLFYQAIRNYNLEDYLSLGEKLSASTGYLFLNHRFPSLYIPSDLLGVSVIDYNGIPSIEINESRTKFLEWKLDLQNVNIITTGFFGKDKQGKIKTLGRNSSDYSAASLSAITGSKKLFLFKDVNGIYEGDPKTGLYKSPLKRISYEFTINLIKNGSPIVHQRAVELCRDYEIDIFVQNFNANKDGTIVSKFEDDLELITKQGNK